MNYYNYSPKKKGGSMTMIIIILLVISTAVGLYFTGYIPGTNLYKKRVVDFTKITKYVEELPEPKAYYNEADITKIKTFCTFVENKSKDVENFSEYFKSLVEEIKEKTGKSPYTITECDQTLASIDEIKELKDDSNYDEFIKLLKELPKIDLVKTYTSGEYKNFKKYFEFYAENKDNLDELFDENPEVLEKALEKSGKSKLPSETDLFEVWGIKELELGKFINLLKALPNIVPSKNYTNYTDVENTKIKNYNDHYTKGESTIKYIITKLPTVKNHILKNSGKTSIPDLRILVLTKTLGYTPTSYANLYNDIVKLAKGESACKYKEILENSIKKSALDELNIIDSTKFPKVSNVDVNSMCITSNL